MLRAKIAAARWAMEHDNQAEADAALRVIHLSLLELPNAIAAWVSLEGVRSHNNLEEN
jgi:hypothetical protein